MTSLIWKDHPDNALVRNADVAAQDGDQISERTGHGEMRVSDHDSAHNGGNQTKVAVTHD
ncbi:hypothetical protein HUK83_08360 [Endobacter medicaginis]|nr:hypothetical protein [Endobacter medicaginis]NVN30345.1 hypothetical protein [Endobacter medicaginis]